jgi:hypothetical protein
VTFSRTPEKSEPAFFVGIITETQVSMIFGISGFGTGIIFS